MRLSFIPFATLAASVVAQSDPGQIPFKSSHAYGVDDCGSSALAEDFGLDTLRLLQFSVDDVQGKWMTERHKLEAKAQGMHFMDITDTPFLGWSKKQHFSYPAPNSTIVDGVLSGLSKSEPKVNLEHFTSYHTRYYTTETGKASAEWLYAKILAYTVELASEKQQELISIEAIQHPWPQNSIVVRIAPQNASDSDPITIIGAHIDSFNHAGFTLRAPGAGDDGSGTVTILEAYRALLLGNYIPASPLEFHFYAGEEASNGGLLGSQALASLYEESGKEVKGMIQFDMTAWHKAGTREEIAIMTNHVDHDLTEFLILLVDRYLDIPWVKDHYPAFADSDHVSWTKAGYQSAHALEGQFKYSNPHIHGADDRIDISPEFSFDHLIQFSKLAVAFAIELSSY